MPAYQRHELICKATFRGEAPDVEWFKAPGRIRLANNPRFVVQESYNAYDTIVTSRLIFKNALPSDSGTYMCEMVSNGIGVSQVSVQFWSGKHYNQIEFFHMNKPSLMEVKQVSCYATGLCAISTEQPLYNRSVVRVNAWTQLYVSYVTLFSMFPVFILQGSLHSNLLVLPSPRLTD